MEDITGEKIEDLETNINNRLNSIVNNFDFKMNSIRELILNNQRF